MASISVMTTSSIDSRTKSVLSCGKGVAVAGRETPVDWRATSRLTSSAVSQRIGTRRELDRHARGRVAVEARHVVVALAAELDARDVRQPHHRAVPLRLHDDAPELLRRRRGAKRAVTVAFEHLLVRRRQRAELPGGHLRVLRLDGRRRRRAA